MTAPPPSERTAWIALASTPGVGDVTFQRLIARYGRASEALLGVARLSGTRADAQLAGRLGMRHRVGLAAAIRRAAADPNCVERRMQALGGWTLTPLDDGFPSRLDGLDDPPTVIFGLGSAASLVRQSMVAVVGTRRPTGHGRVLAARVAGRLAQAGVTVVSGLAVGIDAAAHMACLDAQGNTVAIVGSGLDQPGPASQRRLAQAIAAHGAVIGELAPGVPPTRGTFPRRNRLISALAAATIVVEAPARSGALITARHALEQGRQLLVVPGRPLDRTMAGNLALLRETPARPLVGLDEMIVDLGLVGEAPGATRPGGLSADAAMALLGPAQRAVARALMAAPRDVDGIVAVTDLPPAVVAAALTILQLRGWVRAVGILHLPAGPLGAGPAGRAGPAG